MNKQSLLFSRILLLITLMISAIFVKGEPAAIDSTAHSSLSFLQAQPETTHFQYAENPAMSAMAGYAYGTNVWTSELYSFDPADLATTSVLNSISVAPASADFAPNDASHLWLIDLNDNYLKKLDINNGNVVDSVAMPVPLADGTWTVLTINRTNSQFYAVATDGTQSVLYQVDPSTGNTTVAMDMEIQAAISGTFDADGFLYLFDIGADEMWRVDLSVPGINLLGPAGFDGNYAQGMGFDPQTGNVYLAAYNNDIGPELRLLDKVSGNTTLIGELPGETTGFGFPDVSMPDLVLMAGKDMYTVPSAILSIGEDVPLIPEEFFGPGSDPFTGNISLKGANSQGSTEAEQDVVVQRLNDLETPEPFPTSGTVDIQMVELSLRSVQPITVQTPDGPTMWDVQVQLAATAPQNGVASILRQDLNGGTFTMDMVLFPVFVFTNIENPGQQKVFNPMEFGGDGLPLVPADPLDWMVPPIPGEFDPIGEQGITLITPSGNTIILVPFLVRNDNFFLSMNEEGQPEAFEGTGYNNSEWYYYPFTDWWNVWFYDHPFDATRHKLVSGYLEVQPRDPSLPSYVEIIVNWSTPEWPQWPGFPEPPLPPLPGEMIDPEYENQVIERSEPIFIREQNITEPIPVPIPSDYLNLETGLFNFNPEWISIDLRGFNFVVTGNLVHICFKPWTGCEVICPEDMEVCSTDDPFELTGASPAGGFYSGNGVSADGVFDPGSANWGNNTITYTYLCPDGTTATCSFNIYVIPPPEMVCPPDMMVCYGDIVTLSGGLPGGGSYSGPGVSGNTFSSIGTGIGTFEIHYSVSDPCPGQCTFYITVNPNPEIVCPEDFTMCETDAPIDLMDLVTPKGGTFTGGQIFDPSTQVGGPWQINYTYTDPNTGCSSTCTFYITVYPTPEVICPEDMVVCESDDPIDLASLGASPAGGTFRDALGNEVSVFDPTGAGPASYVFTYCYTDPDTGCTGCCEFAITVYPNPEIECPEDFTMCANDPPIDLMTKVSPTGGTFSGGQIFDPATAPPGVPLQIKYTYVDPDTGCEASCIFYITVWPTPEVDCPADMEMCIDDAAITLSASPSGGSFSGTGISGDSFDPASAGVGTHAIEYCYTDPQTGCEGCCEFTIVVHDLPEVECPQDITVCLNDPAFPLTGATPAGGTYSDALGNPIGMFNPAAFGVGLHAIFYDYTDPDTGCSNWCVFFIEVLPLPVVNCPPDMEVCIDSAQFTLAGGTPAGGSYSGPGVAGGKFTAANAGAGTHNITYTYTDPDTGCSNSCTFKIVVHDLPNVVCPPNMTVCDNEPAFMLNGATPAGGTYSDAFGPLVMFNPAWGPGIYTIFYDYTDPVTGCSNWCSFTITVLASPVVTCPPNMTVCENDPSFNLAGGNPAGGVYTNAAGVAITSFNPATAPVGINTITYTYTDPVTGCSNSCTFTITVIASPNVTCPPNQVICIDNGPVVLAGGLPAGGWYVGPGVAGGVFNPLIAGAGVHPIKYFYTDPITGCTGSCTFTITVNPLPVVICPGNMTVCIDTPAFALGGATPVGGTYTGAGVAAGIFNPAAAGAGAHIITYSYTNPNTGCTNSCSFTITVNPLPTVVCPPDTIVQVTDTAWTLTGGTPAGGVYSDAAGNPVTSFDPAAAGVGFYTLSYKYSDVNGCSDSCTFNITVIGQQDEMDFGDAPDGIAGFSYNTLLANLGARHVIVPGIFLGDSIDAESDGQPTLNADGDDLVTSDDEDGVILPATVSPGSTVTISVKASIDGFLDGWMDFNMNGTWIEPAEHIFSSQFVAVGVNSLSFTVPAGASYGETYLRFRFRDYPGSMSYRGMAQNGEVEDYRITIGEQPRDLDFGDVPDSGIFDYHTLLANNGARHVIDPDVYLGDLIDAESDGQPAISALGDDSNNLDDEDGIRMRRFMAVGDVAKVSVKASVDGFLNAWIDFNRDGKWTGPGEQIFTDKPLAAGWNTFTFMVPASAEKGRTYARFRYNTTGGLSYEGAADDGEVEDYRVAIYPENWGYEITDLSHLIVVPIEVNQVLKASGTYSLMPGDFLGVFYDDNGEMRCGGAILWQGDDNQVLIAYGDDPTTTEKEGFDEGEMMNFKVSIGATGEEFDAQVAFDADQPNADGKFHNNGLSALTGIGLINEAQTLVIPEGWSGISTYLEPLNTNVEGMFAPVEGNLVVLYKLNGSMYWPAQNLNTLGNWNAYDGHVIKMSQDATLVVEGSELTDKAVAIQQGINLIPVLSAYPYDVEMLFSNLQDLVMVKEVAGSGVYLPAWNINTIGSVIPGNAYFVLSGQDGVISFDPGSNKSGFEMPDEVNVDVESPWNPVSHTPGSHVVVFNTDISDITDGDVIGGFTGDGRCAGLASVSGDASFALALNAADPFDADASGFEDGETISYKLYRSSTDETLDLDVEYSDTYGNGSFTANGLSEVTHLKVSSTGTIDNQAADIGIYPNPSSGIFNISNAGNIEFIEVMDAYGKLLMSEKPGFDQKVDLSGYPTGMYFLRAVAQDGSESIHKLIVR